MAARIISLLWVFVFSVIVHSTTNPIDLPVLPDTHLHHVPKIIWISTKTMPDQYPPHILRLRDLNPDWRLMIFDDKRQSLFLEKHFRNTSVLWAFDKISRDCCGAARADLFRYAALYLYGGVYLDYDSNLNTPLEGVIEENDEFIISGEDHYFNISTCYASSFIDRYGGAENIIRSNPADGRVMVQWILISSPRHVFLQLTLEHAVEVIRSYYIKTHAETVPAYGHSAAHGIFCATGPSALTFAASRAVLRNPNAKYRYIGIDYNRYGGVYKVEGSKGGSNWKYESGILIEESKH